MTIIFLCAALILCWMFWGWRYVSREEKVGDNRIPLNGKIKLCRIIIWLGILLVPFLRVIEDELISVGLGLLCIILLLILKRIEMEEQVRSATSVLANTDPELLKKYREDKRFDYNAGSTILWIVAIFIAGVCVLFLLD